MEIKKSEITSDPPVDILNTPAGKIAISREGDSKNPLLLCVHGIPGSHRDFRYLAPHLSDSFFVVRIDMPGFGDSPLGSINSVSGWAKVLLAVADFFRKKDFFLLGHSFGGGCIYRLAAEHSERTRGMFLLASVGIRRHRGYGGKDPKHYHRLGIIAGTPVIRQLIVSMTRNHYGKLGLKPPEPHEWQIVRRHLQLIGSLDFELISRQAPQLQVPALLCCCLDDRIVEPEIVAETAEVLPKGQLVTYAGGGHHLQKTQAYEIASKMKEFLLTLPC